MWKFSHTIVVRSAGNWTRMSPKRRFQEQMCQERHGPPKYSRTLFEDVSRLLQTLYMTLPLNRLSKVVRSASNEAEFARTYGRTIFDKVKREDAITTTGHLHRDRAEPVLKKWLQNMCRLKGTSDCTHFEWPGFYLFLEMKSPKPAISRYRHG